MRLLITIRSLAHGALNVTKSCMRSFISTVFMMDMQDDYSVWHFLIKKVMVIFSAHTENKFR